MRVLLVKPRARLGTILGLQGYLLLEPLELGYLAAVVPREHEVRVLDLRLARFADRAFRQALARRPDLVGFSSFTHEASEVKRLAAIARRALPQALIVVGGHHPTVSPEDFDVPTIDAIVRGEGCGPFSRILGALERKDDLAGIPSVLRPGPGFEGTGPLPSFPDPATLPSPRRDLWNPAHYRIAWAAEDSAPWEAIFPRVAMVRSSWGCRMRCTFCVVPLLCDGVHRPRPAGAVADEIAALPVDHVYFSDDENFIDEAFGWELAEALERRRVRKRYFAWTRATTVTRSPELMRRWRALGLDAAFLGFEFATDRELRDVHKGATVANNERALETLRGMGVAVHAAFMVRPEYDAGDFDRLRDYLRHLPPAQCSFTVCTPSPGTPDYAEMKPRIWVDNPHDLHDAMHPLVATRLPLVEFARRFADLAAEGIARGPRRLKLQPAPPLDLLRVWLAGRRYDRGFRELYRDFPRRLWDLAGVLRESGRNPAEADAAP